MAIIDKAVFQELAYNNPRDALFATYSELERADVERAQLVKADAERAEHVEMLERTLDEHAKQIVALQQTVAALFEAVNAPAVP